MPNSQPSNAPSETPADAREEASVARQVADGSGEDAPGGGGLGGQAAADRLGGSGRTPRGTAPNAPIDVATPPSAGTHELGEGRGAERDAQVEASQADAPEPHPSSL